MSGILDPQDSHIPSRLLNDVNDPSPGQVLTSPSGSIVQPYYGQVGKRLVLTAAMAATLSDTAIGTLFEGIYQYVQVRLSTTNAPARGTLCYWQDYENYIVTPDQSSTDPVLGGDNSGLVAGVFLSAPTKGQYCFIQIAGKASVLFKTNTTKTPTKMGDMVIADGTTSPRGDVLNDATPMTMLIAKTILGVALTTPSGNVISLVDLWNLRQVMGGLKGF